MRFRSKAIAAIAVGMALAPLGFASSASATTVYDYVYSGTYFDGSGAGKAFDGGIGGIEYDQANHDFYVTDARTGGGGTITRLNATGSGVPFSSTASPELTLPVGEYGPYGFGGAQVAVDHTGGSYDGRIYAVSPGDLWGWEPDGTLVSAFSPKTAGDNFAFGVDVLPDGNIYTTGNGPRGEMSIISPLGDSVANFNSGSPGLKTSVNAKWSETGLVIRTVLDNNEAVYGVKNDSQGCCSGSQGQLLKTSVEAEETYALNNGEEEAAGRTGGVAVDHSNDNVFATRSNNTFEEYDEDGRLLGKGFGGPDPGRSYLGLDGEPIGIAVDPETNDVWIANKRDYSGVGRVEKFEPVNPHIIPTTTAIKPDYSDPTGNTIVLRGTINPEGQATTDCHFEYTSENEVGTSRLLSKSLPCTQGKVIGGTSDVEVTSPRIPVKHGIRYWYKVSAKNANGQVARSNTENFLPQSKPILGTTLVERISTDGAKLRTEFDPNGGNASVHFEYGVSGGPLDHSTPETDTVGFNSENENFGSTSKYEPGVYEKFNLITGLAPDTNYEYRAVVTNEAGAVQSQLGTFRTYQPDSGTDPCPNALVRKQTGSALLLDCRGYELASAANAGGFDVESDILPGLEPLSAYPSAKDSLLYSVHFGVIPGVAGSPTNLGLDPYVARRTENGWKTEYVGLPADEMADGGAFGSPLLGADSQLNEFAFGGPKICSPCFENGSTNIPLRLSNGELVEGISGSQGSDGNPAGKVVAPFSADGSHFVFITDTAVEPGGSTEGSVYERDLKGGGTELVSTDTSGTALAGGDIAELGVSADGSRVVFGQRIATDSDGNEYWHLYMHLAGQAESIDLTPGAVSGALYDGMSADGSRVFLTTSDKLLPGEDTDSMADVYEATSTNLRLISTKDGSPSNDESCEPPGSPETWNSVSGDGKCDAVAFSAGAGVAASGTFYFMSPELLDGGQGEAGQVNLYVVQPGGDPEFVDTIDSSAGKAAPQPDNHPVAAEKRVEGLSRPESVAVDSSGGSHDGDIYVFDGAAGSISRYKANGTADNFSALPGPTNAITGLGKPEAGRGEVAVDVDPSSPFAEDVYATDTSGIDVFAPSGEKLGAIGGLTAPCGVAVEPSSGDVYVAEPSTGTIWRYAPIAAVKPVTAADYVKTALEPEEGSAACQLAADGSGHVYLSEFPEGPVKRYDASDFQVVPTEESGTVIAERGSSIGTDAASGDLYIDSGTEIVRYGSGGEQIQAFGSEALSGSRGVAIDPDTKHVFAGNGANVIDFGVEEIPYHPIDQPGAIDGVKRSGVFSRRDFQVTADGRYAAFSTKDPITGYPTLGHSQIYRYDSQEDETLCASCSPTGGATGNDTFLSPTGLNLTEDGRLFFATAESLTLRDTNEKSDVYEWELPDASHNVGGCTEESGCTRLVSTGIGSENSGLVTASSNGLDVFFSTRDVLAHEDENGNAVKIYDAREKGGFVHDPPRKACAASDECHGAGSEVPPAPVINTITGSGPATPANNCKKGYVKKSGKCMKKPKKKKHHHRRHHHRNHGKR